MRADTRGARGVLERVPRVRAGRYGKERGARGGSAPFFPMVYPLFVARDDVV